MHDKRLTNRLITLWENIRKDRAMPEAAWFNPASVDDIWNQCFKLKREGAAATFSNYCYEYMGSMIAEAYGQDLTGKTVNAQSKHFPGARIISKIDGLGVSFAPLMEEGQFINTHGKVVKFRSCLLPFGNAGNELTHVIGGVSWRSF